MKNTFLLHPQWTWAGFLCTSLDLNPEPPTQSQRVILVSYLSGNMSLTASPDESDDQFNNQLCIRGKLHLRPLSSLSCQHVYTWCSGLQLQFGSCSVQFHVDLQSDPLSLPGCLWLSALKMAQWLKTPARDLETWDRSSPGTIRGMWWRCECGVHVCGAQKQNFRCVNKTSFNRSRVRSWNLRRLRCRRRRHHLTVQQAGGNHTQVRPGESN